MTTTTGPNVDPLAALRAATVVAVLRAPTAEAGIRATAALVAGGVTGIEITYSTPDAAAVIREVRAAARRRASIWAPARSSNPRRPWRRSRPGRSSWSARAPSRSWPPPCSRPVPSCCPARCTPSEVMATPRLRRTRGEAVSGLARRAGLPQGVAGALPGRRLRAHRRRRRGQPRRLAGGGRDRHRSRRGPVPARGHGRRRLGRPSPRPPGATPPRRSGPGSRRDDSRRPSRTWASSGSAPAARPSGRSSRSGPTPCGLPTRTLVGHDVALDSPAPVYREVVAAIRDDPQHWGALVTTHKMAVHAAAARPVRRLRRPGRDVRGDLLHRQARRSAGRQRQGPGDRPARAGGVPGPGPLRPVRRGGAHPRLRRGRDGAQPPARRTRGPARADHLHRADPGAARPRSADPRARRVCRPAWSATW